MKHNSDIDYIRMALSMARRGLGRTAPNPSVGCIIVKNDVILGRGRTAEGGRPHAEAQALQQAGAQARGATAYVTLEPCAHQGETGPCAKALAKAGVARVVIGALDPDPRVSGKGIEILKAAGIEFQLGVLEEECREITKGFILRLTENRPLVTLKIAVTDNDMIAPNSGQREWITGPLARRHVHQIRSQHDAILVGINTVFADDPLLTTRLKGVTHKPPRIVLDSDLKIPLDSQLVRSISDAPLWVFYKDDSEHKAAQLEMQGASLFHTGTHVPKVLETLAAEGITRVLVEGGAEIIHSFAQAGVCDQFLLYKAPQKQWMSGKALGFDELKKKLHLKQTETHFLGEDLLEIYQPSA